MADKKLPEHFAVFIDLDTSKTENELHFSKTIDMIANKVHTLSDAIKAFHFFRRAFMVLYMTPEEVNGRGYWARNDCLIFDAEIKEKECTN